MKISNIPKYGVRKELDKWYYCFEIKKCPSTMFGVIKPQIFVAFVKWKQFGEDYLIDGKKEIKIGGWKRLTFPWGLVIEII